MVEVLEQDDTLAAEATSEENENGAGLEGGSEFCGSRGFACLFANPLAIRSSYQLLQKCSRATASSDLFSAAAKVDTGDFGLCA